MTTEIVVYDPANVVVGANSYVSPDELRTYATLRGRTAVAADPGADKLLIQAMDWLEAQADNYKGERTSDFLNDTSANTADQPFQWPRNDVYLFNNRVMFDNATIPTQLKNAQCELACLVNEGVVLFPAVSGSFVKNEKVGPIEVGYSEGLQTSGLPLLPSVRAILAPLLSSGGGFGLSVDRA